MTWMPAPRAIPHRCVVTRQGGDGPFWEGPLYYFAAGRNAEGRLKLASPQVQRLYFSAQGLTSVLNEPGSPLVAVDREVWDDTKAALAEAEGELAAANDRVAELEAKLSEYQDRPEMPSAEDIALLVAEKIKPLPRQKAK